MFSTKTFVVFTAVHFALSITALFIAGGLIMAAFDGKGSAFAAVAAGLTMDLLLFPLVNGLSDAVPSLRELGTVAEYALFAANSMIWGIAAAIVWAWWRKRRAVVVSV